MGGGDPDRAAAIGAAEPAGAAASMISARPVTAAIGNPPAEASWPWWSCRPRHRDVPSRTSCRSAQSRSAPRRRSRSMPCWSQSLRNDITKLARRLVEPALALHRLEMIAATRAGSTSALNSRSSAASESASLTPCSGDWERRVDRRRRAWRRNLPCRARPCRSAPCP